jgi:hypothetical protein
MKIKEQKNGNYTTFERENGWYVVRLHKRSGELLDKMRCDTYRGACEYFKSFNLIAKNGVRT